MTALALNNSISLPSTLLFTGAANILTGVAFGLPLPVQPMVRSILHQILYADENQKAIAAVAIYRHFSISENAAAGLVVAALVGIMSITGLIHWASHMTPVPVVKGIQVGAGLSLCLSAGSTLLAPLSWWGHDSLLWALFAALLLLVSLSYPRMPYTVIVFALGILLSTISPSNEIPKPPSSHAIPVILPSGHDFWKATTTASLGQLPLTLLNSVIAASALASELLPSPPYPAAPSVTSLGLSVSLINLVGCWFGAMPACHGSGGLAGQYRFGARSGTSIIFLGSVKFLLGVFALWNQQLLLKVLHGIPKSLLGVLVLAAGVELAKVGESVNTNARDLWIWEEGNESGGAVGKRIREVDEADRKDRWEVMLVTAAALLTFKNDAIGFLAGLMWHLGLKMRRTVGEGRQRSVRYWWRRNRHSEAESAALLRGSD